MKQIGKEQFVEMPWKNGGGTTRELFKLSSESNFKLRLSVATVSQDGPFSHFPEIDRTLLILTGKGCRLHAPTGTIELRQGDMPYCFKGEDKISCSLIDGAFQDFNVMIDRAWGEAKTSRVKSFEKISCRRWTFVYDPKEELLTELGRGEEFSVKNDSIVVEIILR